MPDELATGTDAGADAAEAGTGATSPGPRYVIERPPPGLARGKYAWPAWGIGALGAIVVALCLGYLIWRLVRARRR